MISDSQLPTLSLVVPARDPNGADIKAFLESVSQQDYPPEKLEVLVQGYDPRGPEAAKALGIIKAQGEIIGLFCADNLIVGASFLRTMATAAASPDVVGSYTQTYYYDPHDASLNRYFALLGANDPLCWWLGKADRGLHLRDTDWSIRVVNHAAQIPTIGDNGFFIKRPLLQSVVTDPATHFCIDACEDLRAQGHSTYAVVGLTTSGVKHASGDTFAGWLKRRYVYAKELYFQRLGERRWRMVQGWRDWLGCVAFAVSSLLVVPMLLVSGYGYRRVKDPAWLWHPVACGALTLAYAWALVEHLSSRLLLRRGTGRDPSGAA